jgi:FG-GAP repeat protein
MSDSNGFRLLLSSVFAMLFFASSPLPSARAQCEPQELAQLGTVDDTAAFGSCVGVSNDTIVVGTSYNSAYVFVKSNDVWIQQAKLSPQPPSGKGYFGWSVAISGETIVVGDLTGVPGSAHVFVRSGETWELQATLVPDDGLEANFFGASVSIDGDTLVVGSVNSVYVFNRNGTTWTQQAKLESLDADNWFGWSVSIDGNTVLVGAPNYGPYPLYYMGAAYVFVRNNNTWTQQAKLIASQVGESDHLGYSVALSGDTAVAGAYSDDHSELEDAGSAYIFTRVGSTWHEAAQLRASDARIHQHFGHSVAARGNLVAVGAPLGVLGEGTSAVYVFSEAQDWWHFATKLEASSPPFTGAGYSVGLLENLAVVGAPLADPPGPLDYGLVYLFDPICDEDSDGVINSNDSCPGTIPGTPVDSTGRPLRDCNLDCTFNSDDIQCIVDELLGQ